jgi:hypothetical protein
MNVKRWLVVLVAMVSIGLSVGCSGGSKTGSAPDKTRFCSDNLILDQAAATGSTPGEALQALKAKQFIVDDFAKSAPPEVKTDAQRLVSAANAAFAANDPTLLNDFNFQAVTSRIHAYCGQSSDLSSNGSAPASAGPSASS